MRGDQRTMDAVAWLIFGAAVFAAFNLTSRIVEAKRRELGVGMALGQPRWSIAMRPMLMGLQVALLGVASGWASACSWPEAYGSVMESIAQPMPVFRTPFQMGEFLQAALIGLLASDPRDAMAGVASRARTPGRCAPDGVTWPPRAAVSRRC